MKIIYFSPHPHLNLAALSGYGTHMREMIASFKKNGHDVSTLIMGGDALADHTLNINFKSSFPKKALKLIVPNIAWETVKDYNLRKFDEVAYKQLCDKIIKEKPDLIYERGYYMMTSGVRAAKEFNIKHVLEINAPYTQERIEMQGQTLMQPLAIRKEGKQILFTDRLIVVSSALKDYFAKKYPLQADKIIITPNAINPDKMAIDNSFVADLKKQYNLNDCTIIGFVGSIFPYHGVDNLIIAFDEIKKQITKKIKLVIVGDGETLPELKQLTTKLKLNEDIIFTGNVKNNLIYNYISVMDITVMAKSNWYGSPVKIFEYGALAKAIIAPDTIPVKDVMDNLQDGILVNEQKENLVEALLILITDEEKRKELGLHFKKKTMENHTWDKMAEKVLDGLEVFNPVY